MPSAAPSEFVVGIVANPASGRDIRRLTAKASVFPTAEKANMIQRLLGPLGQLGVDRVLMMPDATGISAGVIRAVRTHHAQKLPPWPRLDFVDMALEDGAEDSATAARAMAAAGARLIVVLGGDGTHRVVAGAVPEMPLATLSTGTNNVFPDLREATVTGLAVGVFATGRVAPERALKRNKCLYVQVGGRRELALVDVCVTRMAHVGARAVWAGDTITELFVAFAEPDAIGLSSIAAMVAPVGRDEPCGAYVRCAGDGRSVWAPIAPGLVSRVGVAEAGRMQPAVNYVVTTRRGSIALDGEREIELLDGDGAEVRLSLDGPWTLDVGATLGEAVRCGALGGDAVRPPDL
ncbi:MAG: NAD(+)/NADH kinase [Rhodocyclaceae bacterium]|nr:NAD(+)/NADH kinase [Rhodocyclaceae bacterium]